MTIELLLTLALAALFAVAGGFLIRWLREDVSGKRLKMALAAASVAHSVVEHISSKTETKLGDELTKHLAGLEASLRSEDAKTRSMAKAEVGVRLVKAQVGKLPPKDEAAVRQVFVQLSSK